MCCCLHLIHAHAVSAVASASVAFAHGLRGSKMASGLADGEDDLQVALALPLSLNACENKQLADLQRILTLYAVRPSPVPTDGNCQFHAVTESEGAAMDAITMRHQACTCLVFVFEQQTKTHTKKQNNTTLKRMSNNTTMRQGC